MERFISWSEIRTKVQKLIDLNQINFDAKVYGVPRGGQYLSALFVPVDTPEEADVIIDDLIESGATEKRYKKKFPNKKFIALFKKHEDDKRWYVFPWELKEEPLKDNVVRICQYYDLKEVETVEELIFEYENR